MFAYLRARASTRDCVWYVNVCVWGGGERGERNRHTDTQTHRQIDRHTDTDDKDRERDIQTNRQTDRLCNDEIVCL